MKVYKRCSVKDEIQNEWLHQRLRNLKRYISPQSIVANRIIFLSFFSLNQNSVLSSGVLLTPVRSLHLGMYRTN